MKCKYCNRKARYHYPEDLCARHYMKIRRTGSPFPYSHALVRDPLVRIQVVELRNLGLSLRDIGDTLYMSHTTVSIILKK